MINIKEILRENKIHFVSEGHNVSKNNININCPFCAKTANPDPSEHLGINLDNGWWGCWRDSKHRGKNVYRLFAYLGIESNNFDYETTLEKIANGKFFTEVGEEEKMISNVVVEEFPSNFIPIGNKLLDKNYFKPYLRNRGFNPEEVIERYKLMRSSDMNDKWGWRIIVPIFMEYDVSWVARSIVEDTGLRYLTPTKAEARNVKDCLWNYKELANTRGKYLVICEGVFDAMKIDMLGDPDVRATCSFGVQITEKQFSLIRSLTSNWVQLVVAFDADATNQAFRVWQQLSMYEPIIARPKGRKDFGAMDEEEIVEFQQSLVSRKLITAPSNN